MESTPGTWTISTGVAALTRAVSRSLPPPCGAPPTELRCGVQQVHAFDPLPTTSWLGTCGDDRPGCRRARSFCLLSSFGPRVAHQQATGRCCHRASQRCIEFCAPDRVDESRVCARPAQAQCACDCAPSTVTAPPTCLCVPTGLASCARVSLLEAAARLSFGGFEAMDLSLGVCVAVM